MKVMQDLIDRDELIAALIAEKDDSRHANSPNLRTGLQVAIQIVMKAQPCPKK